MKHHRVCNLCEAMCGLEVSVGGTPSSITIRPDKEDPFSRGSMCPKAPMLAELHTDPERLRHPVKRVAGDWVEISWDEAIGSVIRELKRVRDEYGADAIASYLGNPIVHNLGMTLYIKQLTEAIGSRNVFSATSMDQLPHHFAAHHMFGHEFRIPVPDVNRTDFMIVMGANPIASNGSIMTSAGIRERLKAVQARGGQLVVIDPRRTETAELADEHLFIRPASDVYFLLAFMHVLVRDGHLKPGRLEAHLQPGAVDSLEPLLHRCSPEAAAVNTGIDAGAIESLVTRYMGHSKAVLYGRMGLSTQAHGGLCHWLINCINIVSGHFDTPGGMMFPTPAIELARAPNKGPVTGRWHSRVRRLPEFYGELPVAAMTEEMTTPGDGQVRAFMTVCGNPVLSTPNGKRLESALPGLDFMVSIDNYINETTRHATIILPTPSGLEIDHYDVIFNLISVSNNAKFSEALFPPAPDRPADWQILKRLITGLSRRKPGALFRWLTPRRIVDLGLKTGAYGRLSHPSRWLGGLTLKQVINSEHGIDLGPLQPRVPEGLLTSDGKINLVPKIFLEAADALILAPPGRDSGAAQQARFPLRLIGRRHVSTNNSWMHQFRKLSASSQVRCTAMLHPQDARVRNIRSGALVRVHSAAGKIDLRAEVTDAVMCGVVCIPHGFGHHANGTRISNALLKPGVSVNDITSELHIDPVTGNAAFSGLPLEVEKISDPDTDASSLTDAGEQVLSGKPLLVVYGSRTGNAEFLACDISESAQRAGLLPQIAAMNTIDAAELAKAARVLVICSTYGEGDMPDNAEALWQAVSASVPNELPDFSETGFAVLALGDRSYDTFCAAGKQWDRYLEQLGATRLYDRIDCDVDYEADAQAWLQVALPALAQHGDQAEVLINRSIPDAGLTRISRANPWQATVLTKERLSGDGSTQEIYHYALSIAGSSLNYRAGDSINVMVSNSDASVNALLDRFGGDAAKIDTATDASVRSRLLRELEWGRPSRRFLRHLASSSSVFAEARVADSTAGKLKQLQAILDAEEPDAVDCWIDGRDTLDLLDAFPAAVSSLEQLLPLLSPLQPRAYSIASSPLQHPEEIHLTVSTVRRSRQGRDYPGLASGYLADHIESGDTLRVFPVPSSDFVLPENPQTPIIMIGPGTGLAPFRGFLQQRAAEQLPGEAWLFFGNPHRSSDFLYQHELQSYLESGVLTRLDLAFSRDQNNKIYVQDRLREHAERIYQWMQRGAVIYVCGDAGGMALGVEQELTRMYERLDNLDAAAARAKIHTLKATGRYLLDVY